MKEGGRKAVTPYARLQEQIAGAIPRAGLFQSDLKNLQKTMASMEPMLYDIDLSRSKFTDRYLILLEKLKSLIPRLLQFGTRSNRANLERIHKSLKKLYQEYVKTEMEDMARSKEVADDKPIEDSVQTLLTYLGRKIGKEVTDNPTNSSKPVFQNLDITLSSLETEFQQITQTRTLSRDRIHKSPEFQQITQTRTLSRDRIHKSLPSYTPQLLLLLNQVKLLLRFLHGKHGLDIASQLQIHQEQLKKFISKEKVVQEEKIHFLQDKSERKKYDIFLNFRGADVRYTVAGLLHNNLEKANISTFFDERSAPKSKRYWEEIQKAIGTSEGAITILSDNYGDSEDCLDELLLIQKRGNAHKDYMLRPIFYDIQPEHLTDPKSKFGRGFETHKKTANHGKVKEWTEALVYVRSFNGDVHNSKQDHLDVLIDKVVEDFKNQLQNMRVAKR